MVVFLAAVACSSQAQSLQVEAGVASSHGNWSNFQSYNMGDPVFPPIQVQSPIPNAADYDESSDDGWRQASFFSFGSANFNELAVAASVDLLNSYPGQHTAWGSASFTDSITFNGGSGNGKFKLALFFAKLGNTGTSATFTGNGLNVTAHDANVDVYYSDEMDFTYGSSVGIFGNLSTTIDFTSAGFDSGSSLSNAMAGYQIWVTDPAGASMNDITVMGDSGYSYSLYSPVPEPASMAVLGIGLLGFLRRKRK